MCMVGKCSGWWELKCFPLSEFSPLCIWMTQEDTRGKKRKKAEDSTLYFPLGHPSVPPPLVTYNSAQGWSGQDLSVHRVGSQLKKNVISVSCSPNKPSWSLLLIWVQSLWLCTELWKAGAAAVGSAHVKGVSHTYMTAWLLVDGTTAMYAVYVFASLHMLAGIPAQADIFITRPAVWCV